MGEAFGLLESRFADVTFPTYGMSCAEGIVYDMHQRVERKVAEGMATHIVGHLKGELLAKGMVAEAGQGDIFVGHAHTVGELQRRIFGTKPEDRLQRRVHGVVEKVRHLFVHLRESAAPCHTLTRRLLHLAHHHAVVGFRAEGVVMGETHTHHQVDAVLCHAAGAYLLASVRQIDALGLLFQQLTGKEMGRQVHRVVHQQVLALDGGQHGIDPAKVAAPLVFHRSCPHHAHRLRLRQVLLLLCGGLIAAAHDHCHGQDKQQTALHFLHHYPLLFCLRFA